MENKAEIMQHFLQGS